MSSATLDRVLATLVIAMAATGLLSLRAGSLGAAWIYTLHAVLAGALLGATLLKLRRSVPKAARAGRFGRLALGLLVSLGVLASLSGGFLWVASGEPLSVGSWTVLTLHAWVGLAVVPLVAVHLLPHRWRLLRVPASRPGSPRLARRTVLAGSALALAGAGVFGLTALVDRARGGERRFTGSRWLPSGGIPPPTTFYGEGIPTVDIGTWRLEVVTPATVEPTPWSLPDIHALGEDDLSAVLDCTSGWAIETAWHGVPLTRLLGRAAETERGSVRVTSVTGWATILTMAEAREGFLATGVAGGELPVANGAPCRLVIPRRRGLDWVKWVAEIRVS